MLYTYRFVAKDGDRVGLYSTAFMERCTCADVTAALDIAALWTVTLGNLVASHRRCGLSSCLNLLPPQNSLHIAQQYC
jgi:hypothetical protein